MKTKILYVGIVIIVIVAVSLLFLFLAGNITVIKLLTPVKFHIPYSNLDDTEKNLCTMTVKEDWVYDKFIVEKCNIKNNHYFRKYENSVMVTDQSHTTFYRSDGTELCSYYHFSNKTSCQNELIELTGGEVSGNCEWVPVCGTINPLPPS